MGVPSPMLNSKYTWLLLGVVAGYVLSNRIALIPVINKLPKV